MPRNRMINRFKATLFVVVAATGGTMFSGCGAVSLRDAVLNGTQAFATSYVAAFWDSIVPEAGSVIGGDDDA